MVSNGSLSDLEKTMQDFMKSSSADPRLVPLTEEVIKLVRSAITESEDLQRYKETTARMGKESKYSTSAPNFPYTTNCS